MNHTETYGIETGRHVFDGLEIRYGVRPGSSDAVPLLIFNGVGQSIEVLGPLIDALEGVEVRDPRIPVISNVTADVVGGAGEIRGLLAKQLTAPVLWERSMRTAGSRGVSTFLEPGPGKVLAGLMRKIAPEATVRSAATPADLSA